MYQATDFLIDGRRIGARKMTGWQELWTQITGTPGVDALDYDFL